MKSILVLLALTTSAMAADIQATCFRKTDGSLIDDKMISIRLNSSKIQFKGEQLGLMSGLYVKKTKTGSLMFQSDDLMNVADQTDFGYVFVDPGLIRGRDGLVTLTVRQLGDSEGSWWLKDTFNCRIRK